MIVIAILAIPFIFYFNKTDFGTSRITDLGRIYGRTITLTEFSRNARLMNLARGLGLSLPSDLMISNVQTENDFYAEFTWNRQILRHEAEQLGIRPNSTEIADYVKTLSRFKSDESFDGKKFKDFTEELLPSLGLNEAQIEEIVSDQLTLNRVKDLVGAGVQPSESESAEEYQKAYGKMDVAVVRLQEKDFENDATISDEDISKYYEAHKAELKSDEKRRVEFVAIALTEDERKLTGKDRVEPLQKVANRANDFSLALLEKDAKFGDVASKFQVPVVSTEEFTMAKPDPKLRVNPQLAQYSFRLTKDAPISDPIQGTDGFYIVHLLGVTEAQALTLEDAKSKITDTLKAEKVRDLMSRRGAALAQQLRDGLKAGSSLEKVAQQGGLKLERIPTFSLVEAPTPKPEPSKDATKAEKSTTEAAKDAKPSDSKTKDATVADVKTGDVNSTQSASPKVADAKTKNDKSAKQTNQTDTKLAEVSTTEVKPGDTKVPPTAAAATAEVEPPRVKPEDQVPGITAIKNAVFVMNPGEVSDFLPFEKGGLVAVLEKRAPADPAGYAAARANYDTQYLTQNRARAFMEWLRERRKAAGVVMGPG